MCTTCHVDNTGKTAEAPDPHEAEWQYILRFTNYQKYYNTFAFLKEIIKKNKKLQNQICIPNVGQGWMQSFLKLNFFKGVSINSVQSLKPVDSMNSKNKFIEEIDRCMDHRLVPISLEIIVPGAGTHANVIIIDTKKKTVELFEPHGNRSVKSELESISRAYFKVSKNVQRFFSMYLPDFKYIPPSLFNQKNQELQKDLIHHPKVQEQI